MRVEQREVLEAFSRDFDRERHRLATADLERFPQTVFQQLYNRLQWQGGAVAAVVEPQADRRRAPDAPPWLHLRTRLRESEALIRVFASHTDGVTACAYSPDGRTIVSASNDKTLKLWDAESGAERLTPAGHTDTVYACAFSPDGKTIVSASYDGTLRLWDAASGTGVYSFPALGALRTCAFGPVGDCVCCGDMGGSVYILEPVGALATAPRSSGAAAARSRRNDGSEAGSDASVTCPYCQAMNPAAASWCLACGRDVDADR